MKLTDSDISNAGSVAHVAVQRWIESKGWIHEDPSAFLGECFDEVIHDGAIDIALMPNGTLTRERLKTRGPELTAMLQGTERPAQSEELLTDQFNRLFGVLDIVDPGERGLIIDLKTGNQDNRDAINHQMKFYAHLYMQTFNETPRRLVVFSLRKGSIDLQFTRTQIHEHIELIRSAIDSNNEHTNPSAEACRYCSKRLDCEDHWSTLPTWEHPDGVKGRNRQVEHSSSGLYTLQIDSSWLTGIVREKLPDSVRPGQLVRAVRVRRGQNSASSEFHATRDTKIRVSPGSTVSRLA